MSCCKYQTYYNFYNFLIYLQCFPERQAFFSTNYNNLSTCSNKTCQGRAILQLSDPNELVVTTLLKGSEVFKGVVVLSGKCSECKTHYFSDHENYLEACGSRKRVYFNNAKYVKAGQNLHVDQICSNAVVVEIGFCNLSHGFQID